ncbi:MAG TPA: 16S rRNA (cytidine(1402)-2'-O)-methyltransferase [Mycobacteriales bacterium]|nr:16S rRNA (cytidine(1402)-2'-O)-methyltransferase [Mycobacteriales bacterium]
MGQVGTLVLAGVPLGDVRDASPRLAEALGAAPVIAAEDTRRLRRLAARLGVRVTGRVLSYYQANEAARTPELLGLLQAGQDVLLVTDAGMPSVSDPGYRLVSAAAGAGIPVSARPGPSAVTTALALSGLPSDRFCFEGFLPRRPTERRAALAALRDERRTMVVFEAPHRLAAMLADAAGALGPDRPAVACREMTKTYEEVRRGTLGELADWAATGVRGEVTLVLAGAPRPAPVPADPAALAAGVAARERSGQPRREAMVAVAREAGVSRRVVYDAVVFARSGSLPGGMRTTVESEDDRHDRGRDHS